MLAGDDDVKDDQSHELHAGKYQFCFQFLNSQQAVAGETKEEQGLTYEQALEQKRLRMEALQQVMFNMIGFRELEGVVD